MSAVNATTGALNRIDWDFPSTGTPISSIHSLHRFPGNFIPQIPSILIQALTKPGDLVLDPFGGSGTAAVEAIALGRRSIHSDRISACVMFGDAKITALRNPIDSRIRLKILDRFTFDHECISDLIGTNGEGSDPTLSEWYAPSTLAQLRYIWSVIEEQAAPIRKVLELIFSDLLFVCASTRGAKTSSGGKRRHHWGWVADNVKPKCPIQHDALEAFRRALVSLPEKFGINDDPEINALVLQQDARYMALGSNSVDMIVTSPPYIGVIDYTRANRLLYAWMGWPFDAERQMEIGARYKRKRKAFIEEYLLEMSECWSEFSRVLRTGGYCALIIGESRRFQGVAERALEDMSSVMPMIWGPVKRWPTRRRISDRLASEAVEYMSVFRKS